MGDLVGNRRRLAGCRHRGADQPTRRFGNARMARSNRFKLIRRYPFGGVTFPDELYDLQRDPRETINCHGDPSHRNVVVELSAELDRFFSRYTVPGHSGLDLAHQPECTPASPWLVAANQHRQHDPALTQLQRTLQTLAERPPIS